MTRASRGWPSCIARGTTTGRSPRARPTTARPTRTPPCVRCERRPACVPRWMLSSPRSDYLDHLGRPKVVRYWVMHPEERGVPPGRRGRRAPLDDVRRCRGPADLRPRPCADPGAPTAAAAGPVGLSRAAREGRRPGAMDRGRPAAAAHEEGPAPGGRARRRLPRPRRGAHRHEPLRPLRADRAPARARTSGSGSRPTTRWPRRRPSPPRSSCSHGSPTRPRSSAVTGT